MTEEETRLHTPSDEDATEVAPRGAASGRHDVPSDIGPYHLVRPLGEGGMGEVWEARQTEPIARTVALKLVKLGMDTKQFIARFESERQALALMEHPCIARVIDGGATDKGRPYFVMEYVEGVPITEYCDDKRLPIRERLELFISVCEGVQHAHQKGIIHRDLKPSNVLVTEVDGKPVPKIIDFGVAKATTQSLTEKTVQTMLGGWIGTPAYMSPEQAEITDDIDTRTDVYSLGVMLYELLTGLRPFDAETLDSAGFDEMRRVIREVEPPRPSTRVSGPTVSSAAESRRTEPKALVKRLMGDLDWIVTKAVEKERERRFGSPAEFAADLERHLFHKPVVAGPPTRLYRARKYVRRHRIGVSLAASILAGIAATSISAGLGFVRAKQAEARAEARRSQAENLVSFMLGDLRTKLDDLGRLDILSDVGAAALEYFAAVPEMVLTDGELARRSQALNQIGEVRIRQGDLEGAASAMRESLRLAQRLLERRPGDAQRLFDLSQSYFWAGYVAWRRSHLGAAEQSFQDYLDVARQLVALDGGRPEWIMEVAYAYSNLGFVGRARGDLAHAERSLKESVAHTQRAIRLAPERDDWRRELASRYGALGSIVAERGRLAEALAHHQAERSLLERLVSKDGTNRSWQHRLGVAHSWVGIVHDDLGDLEEALQALNEANAELQELIALDPSNLDWKRDFAMNLVRRSTVTWQLGRSGRADLDRAIALLLELVGTDRDAVGWRLDLAQARIRLARQRLDCGDIDVADEETTTAARAVEELLDRNPDHRLALRVRSQASANAARIASQRGNEAMAQDRWRESWEAIRPSGEGSFDPAFLVPLAEALRGLGRDREAEAVTQRLLATGWKSRLDNQDRTTPCEALSKLADEDQLSRPSIPARDHQLRGLALVPLPSQLSRCRGSPWPSVESRSPTRRSASGVGSSVRRTPAA